MQALAIQFTLIYNEFHGAAASGHAYSCPWHSWFLKFDAIEQRLNNGVKFVYEFAKSKFTLIKTYKLRIVEGWWVQNNI